jgi:hypothetical protein
MRHILAETSEPVTDKQATVCSYTAQRRQCLFDQDLRRSPDTVKRADQTLGDQYILLRHFISLLLTISYCITVLCTVYIYKLMGSESEDSAKSLNLRLEGKGRAGVSVR